MPRFVFELEAVLRHRRAQERERQIALARLEAERRRLDEAISSCQDELDLERAELRTQFIAGGTLDIRGVRLQSATSLRIHARAHQSVVMLAGVLRRIDGARKDLLEASRRRRAVELLREKRYAAWLDGLKRKEAGAIDEIAVMRAARHGEAA